MDTGLGAKAYAIIEQGKIGMILSSRPTDRRQLIEEAAGITKYKARRRAAELKLEAAQQNLTRIDDIVFEVEKQRGTLKRQAAKARRYQKLRDELRRWEKVLFARKYRQLAETIESARARLADAREREAAAAARVAEVEADLGRLRIELAEAEARATAAREAAHARELDDQPPPAADRVRPRAGRRRSTRGRRQSAPSSTRSRRAASRRALALDGAPRRRPPRPNAERDRAAATLAAETEAYEAAHREHRRARSRRRGGAQRGVLGDQLGDGAAPRARARGRRARSRRRDAVEARRRRRATCASSRERVERGTRGGGRRPAPRARGDRGDADRARRRANRSWPARASSTSGAPARCARASTSWPALEARLTSLEELDAARAGYGDAARTVLAQANGKVNQQGAVADYLEVDAGLRARRRSVPRRSAPARRRRTARACGRRLRAGARGRRRPLRLPRHSTADARRRRSLALSAPATVAARQPAGRARRRRRAVVGGARQRSVRRRDPRRRSARRGSPTSYDARGRQRAASTPLPVATLDGDVFRGPHLVSGGGRAESRGILETKREIKELRERIAAERDALTRARRGDGGRSKRRSRTRRTRSPR